MNRLPALLRALRVAGALTALFGVISVAEAGLKPRVIVLTDLKRTHETDDTQTLVRMLAWADLVEIEAIVVSSGMNFWNPQHAVDGYAYGFELIEAYRRDLPNLMKMGGQRGFEPVEARQPVGYWPSADYLTQRLVLGTPLQGLDKIGAGKDNDGSRLITAIVDEPDDRPIYVLGWGGANVLAQVLWDLTENLLRRRSPEAVAAFVDKLRVVAIGDQDVPWNQRHNPDHSRNAGHWLRTRFPGLHWVWMDGTGFVAASRNRQAYYQAHIQGHGNLGNAYPDHSNGIEGDTPALLHVLPLGFGDPERPEDGTLAGLFPRLPGDPALATVFRSRGTDRPEDEALSRRLGEEVTDAMWNLLAARLDWARSGTGNRPPIIVLANDTGVATHPWIRRARAGETLRIDATATHDGEMDALVFRWSVLPVDQGYEPPAGTVGDDGRSFEMELPLEAAGRRVHVLLQVTDDGAGHPLSAWRRIIVEVDS